MPSTTKPRLLSIPEVALRLGGLHEQTVRGLIRRGAIGTVHVGRRIMVSEDQLAAFIDARTVDAAS